MNSRSLIVLCVLAVGLLTYVYYGIQKPHDEIMEKGRPEDRLAPGDFSKIEWLTLQTAAHSFRFERQSRGWKMTEPVKDILSQSKIEALIAGLEKLRKMKDLFSNAELATQAPKREQYGLHNPKIVLTYKLSNLATPQKISLGNVNPSSTSTFAETASHGIVLATMDLDYLATQTVNDFREMRLTTVSASDFVEMTLENKWGRIALKKENDQWKMVEPALPVDIEAVRNFVDKIGFVRSTDFVNKVPAHLKKASARLVVGFADGVTDLRSNENDKRPHGMEIAFYHDSKPPRKGQTESEDRYYVLSDKAGAALTSSYHFESFQKKAADLVKKSFDDFLLTSLTGFSVAKGSQKFEVLRDDQGLYRSGDSLLDKEKVEALVNKVRSLKADSFIATAKSLPKDSLVTIQFNLTNPPKEKSSLFFDTFAFRKSGKDLRLWARRGDTILEYKVAANAINPKDFEKAALLPSPKTPPESSPSTVSNSAGSPEVTNGSTALPDTPSSPNPTKGSP